MMIIIILLLLLHLTCVPAHLRCTGCVFAQKRQLHNLTKYFSFVVIFFHVPRLLKKRIIEDFAFISSAFKPTKIEARIVKLITKFIKSSNS